MEWLDIIFGLEKDHRDPILEHLAQAGHTPPEVLGAIERRLSEGFTDDESSFYGVDRAMALNPRLPASSRRRMAQRGIGALVENSAATAEDFAALAEATFADGTGHEWVRRSIEGRSSTPDPRWTPATLHRLVVAELEKLEDGYSGQHAHLLWACLRRTDLAEETCRVLWLTEWRADVLQQAACPADLFEEVVKAPGETGDWRGDPWLRALAHPHCPTAVAGKLYWTHRAALFSGNHRSMADELVQKVWRNPALPGDVVTDLVAQALTVDDDDHPTYWGLAQAVVTRPDLDEPAWRALAEFELRRGSWEPIVDDPRCQPDDLRLVPWPAVLRPHERWRSRDDEAQAVRLLGHPKLPETMLLDAVATCEGLAFVLTAILDRETLPEAVAGAVWSQIRGLGTNVARAHKQRLASRLDCPGPILEEMLKSTTTRSLAKATLALLAGERIQVTTEIWR